MKTNSFWKQTKGNILRLLLSFVIAVIIIFSLIFILKITTNIIVSLFSYLLLLSAFISICMLIGMFFYLLSDYKYQKEHQAIIEKHLKDDYIVVFPIMDNLSPLSILRQPSVICKAKLNSDGDVVLRIENTASNSESFHEASTSNFALFCQMFKFEE